ncbi:Tryptophan--tRNA ligase [Aedoeadaptatus ivorii]|uniref:Tryptophan--tRNA ligase n=1 Tax=Aedoeadaptatus ivorii TaxID=54006 RepID=A0A448V1V9_9FIRM|nr:tryptophan--tRNA ligase [Peptoniphilus ivorii]MDQ0508095.1 tryptophanyl-tRNA synthetase [Peptoniphilus ivorii]VEJ35826.1 Tryptophan--tRNA ligase [Peptoniphilus ivorii]
MDRKIVYSGIQPSGALTIGNYLGALRNFPALQEAYQCIYCVVDMHAITVAQHPAQLRKRTLDLIALYMACGVDPENAILYVQSHVPEHVELAWVLNTITSVGQLNRMTQFKDKSQKQKEIYAGLLNYPVLMAADILLYQTELVPVGEDQRQHIELTRDIAERFNTRYSPTFKIPEIMAPKVGARIMSLQNPKAKMSKSDADENAYILILDEPDAIRRKIKRAVTDSEGKVVYSDSQPGVKNLLDIYASFRGISPEAAEREFASSGYGALKEGVAEAVVEGLEPVQTRYKEIREDKALLESVCKEGAQRASYLAQKTLRKVYRKVGFVQK